MRIFVFFLGNERSASHVSRRRDLARLRTRFRALTLAVELNGHFHCVSPRRVSARLPSNFHLLGQMKVTKANALNTSHLAVSLRLQSSADDEPGGLIELGAACSSLAFSDALQVLSARW